MKLFLVQGVRHSCVVSGTNKGEVEERIKNAQREAEEGKIMDIGLLAGEVVSGWEMPRIEEIKLPSGWELRQVPTTPPPATATPTQTPVQKRGK